MFINLYIMKNYEELKKTVENVIQTDPSAEHYLLLAVLEFKLNNFSGAEMLCYQSLKINENYPKAYSCIAVTSAMQGNYIVADEMIKKSNYFYQKNPFEKNALFSRMNVNEAAIALLKNEKERAYILLRKAISADNNSNAILLYNRYFIKK